MGCPIGVYYRTYPGRASQDLSATCCSRWHRRFSFPSMSIFHKCWEPFCVNRWNNQNPRRELGTIKVASIWLELSRENWLYAGFASGLQRQGWQRVGCLLWTWVVLWVIHLNPVGLRICCKIAKLAGSISKERAGLLSVKFLSMANDVFFRLPFAKVEEMETTGSVMLIWSLNFLSICYRLESPQIYYHIQTWSSEEISEGEQRCRDQSLNLWSSQTRATRSKKNEHGHNTIVQFNTNFQSWILRIKDKINLRIHMVPSLKKTVLLPWVKKQVSCVRDRLKMVKHQAWATTIVTHK